MTFIGIDNGVTGSIGIIKNESVFYIPMPAISELSYTKKKQFITRINGAKLADLFGLYSGDSFCLIERPFTNPRMFKATVSAMRALEATLTLLQTFAIPYAYIDSKEWQAALLPKGLKKEQLKMASLDIAKRLFPGATYTGFKDGDGLLIAEYCRMTRRK